MLFRKLALVAALVAASTTLAHATGFENLHLDTLAAYTFSVDPGEYRQVDLGSWRYVEQLYVQAEGGSTDGMIDVIVNGVTKGTIYVPGRDPSYVITIRESIRTLEFRHLQGGRVYVRQILAHEGDGLYGMNTWETSAAPLGEMARGQAASISAQAISLVDQLQGFADLDEYKDVLFPVKLVAARAYAKAQARGDLSLEVRSSLTALVAQIDQAQKYMNNAFERSNAFNLSLQLLTLDEQLKALLQ